MTVWVRAEEVLWRATQEVVVLLPPEAPEPFALAGTGVLLWRLLERPASLDDMARQLADRFAAPLDQVRADLEATMEQLRGLGVVTCAR